MPESSKGPVLRHERRRSWYRLHPSTFAILLLAAALLVLLVVPGEYTDYVSAEKAFGLGPLTFEHGWPWVYLRRLVKLPPSTPRPTLPHHGVPWLQGRAWSFEGNLGSQPTWLDGDAEQWTWWAVALDGLVALAILAIVAAALEWRQRRRRIWQFSLTELLSLMLLLAAALGWWKFHAGRSQNEREVADKYFRMWHNVDYRGPLWLRRAVGIAHLRPFVRVVMVHVVDTYVEQKIHGHREHLGKLDGFRLLERLRVKSQSVRDDDLRHVGRLLQLRTLYLEMPLITDAGLGHLRGLHGLHRLEVRNGTGVTSDGLRHLSGMKELKFLRLSDTGIDDRALRYVAGLSSLESLDLAGTAVGDEGLGRLATLTNLEALGLAGTAVGDKALGRLATLTSLRHLGLAGTNIDGSGLIHLRSLRNLQTLNLDRTAVSDDDVAQLEEFKLLVVLRIRHTGVSKAGADRLRQALPNCLLGWRPRQAAD